MLKPNLISAKHGSLPCTEAIFILAAARWFVDHGAKVSIGDSPVFGSAKRVLGRLGLLEDLCFLGVDVRDFSASRKCMLPSGKQAAVAVDALECDLLVNLPRIKAHGQTCITLAVKNCFGCLAGLQKPWWHMAYGGPGGCFADLLVDLLSILPECLTLVDGIVAMEKTGPLNGVPKPLQIVAAGTNPVAIDTALLDVLSLSPDCSPLQQAAIRAEIIGCRVEDIVFPLLSPAAIQVFDFFTPKHLKPIRFNPFRFVWSTFRRKINGKKLI